MVHGHDLKVNNKTINWTHLKGKKTSKKQTQPSYGYLALCVIFLSGSQVNTVSIASLSFLPQSISCLTLPHLAWSS